MRDEPARALHAGRCKGASSLAGVQPTNRADVCELLLCPFFLDVCVVVLSSLSVVSVRFSVNRRFKCRVVGAGHCGECRFALLSRRVLGLGSWSRSSGLVHTVSVSTHVRGEAPRQGQGAGARPRGRHKPRQPRTNKGLRCSQLGTRGSPTCTNVQSDHPIRDGRTGNSGIALRRPEDMIVASLVERSSQQPCQLSSQLTDPIRLRSPRGGLSRSPPARHSGLRVRVWPLRAGRGRADSDTPREAARPAAGEPHPRIRSGCAAERDAHACVASHTFSRVSRPLTRLRARGAAARRQRTSRGARF